MRKTKPKKTSYYKNKVWELCKQIVRKTYQKPYGWDCYTCGRRIEIPSDAHTAHFLPSGSCGAFLRYDLRNLRVCCYNCNINLGGNGAEYYRRMVKEKGQQHVAQIFKDKQIIVKADSLFYIGLISEYQDILKQL